MGSEVQLGGRLANVQELRFQTANLWDMASAVRQWGWFADAEESQAPKRSEMGSAVLQGGWFPDVQEPCNYVANSSNMGVALM